MSAPNPAGRPDGARDFDFLHGSWIVRHRRLRHRLVGSDDWAAFDGTMKARPIMSGLGNFDDNVIDLPEGRYTACTVRIYDPRSRLWSIRWIDGRDPKLDPPMVGGFEHGIGTFFGDDSIDGRPIRVRFQWSAIDADGATWEQAFSDDGGTHWETNWTMRLRRMADDIRRVAT